MIGGIRGNLANRDVCRWWHSARAVFQATQRSAEEGRIALRLFSALCAAACLGGCATAAPSLTRHFVRQGTPSVDLGGPKVASKSRTASHPDGPIQAIREISRFSPSAADVDGTDVGLREALKAAQGTPSLATHLAAAQEYRRLGIFDRAFDHLDSGAQFNEHDAGVNDAMARTWRDWGLPGMGLSNAYRAVYAAPRSATVRHTLGTLLHALGRRADAEQSFRQVVDLDPLAWYGWQNLCHLTMSDGRTREAIALCQRATVTRRQALKASLQ